MHDHGRDLHHMYTARHQILRSPLHRDICSPPEERGFKPASLQKRNAGSKTPTLQKQEENRKVRYPPQKMHGNIWQLCDLTLFLVVFLAVLRGGKNLHKKQNMGNQNLGHGDLIVTPGGAVKENPGNAGISRFWPSTPNKRFMDKITQNLLESRINILKLLEEAHESLRISNYPRTNSFLAEFLLDPTFFQTEHPNKSRTVLQP